LLAEKQNKANIKIYIWLFIIAFAVVISSTYNPIKFRRMHVDSSVYVTISQGIIRGQLPYRDFVDNKGPITYFINIPGLLIGGFTGIWITELLFLFVSVIFAYKTALFFGDKNKALLGTVFAFVILMAFFTVYAGTEEYSLPFMMISLYIFTKYYFSAKQDINFVELIVLGFCFGCAILIRLNMFPLWAGFCTVIFFDTITKRLFLQAGKFVLGFCLGVMIIFIPVYLYLKINGIIDDFIAQVVYSGASRGFEGTSIKVITKNFFLVINRTFSIAPLFFGMYYMIILYKKNKFIYYLGYTLSYFLMILFLSFSSGDDHYNMVLVPFCVPAITILIDVLYNVFHFKRAKLFIIACFLCIILFQGIAKYLFDFSKLFFDKSGQEIIEIGKIIDENTKPGDKILSVNNSYLYPFTKRTSVSKYCYQGNGISPIPGAREEFLSDVMTDKPVVIGITFFEGIGQYSDYWHEPILEMIDSEYRLLSDENGFKLFIRK
jgi:hypothetical protein